ncbi:MAG: hypothetical protein BWX80_04072 [Candidatus Hydrogenedentes bacterium ADurb.Bin101]|nr:MAG: hypothetical protein BWX80_04072 [Candidatus Hydrogenedentes bacterium ADurb.Bin101]
MKKPFLVVHFRLQGFYNFFQQGPFNVLTGSGKVFLRFFTVNFQHSGNGLGGVVTEGIQQDAHAFLGGKGTQIFF